MISGLAGITLKALAFAVPAGAWLQNYDATGHWWLSAILAALPLVLLLTLLLAFGVKAHKAALLALAAAIVVAVGLFHMPAKLGGLAILSGAAYGLFPIFWIIFPVIFMYELTVKAGRFALLQQCLTHVSQDGRLQLLLIAFAFGAFFEGAAGFGTPVAVCGTLLMGAGFAPIEAAAYALLANTAPVAFGALGTPVVALSGVTNIDLGLLSRIISALLTPFCIIVPFWLIASFAGFGAMLEIWPAVLLSGVLFGFSQLAIATFHGPWLVDIGASILTIVALLALFRVWKPRRILGPQLNDLTNVKDNACKPRGEDVMKAILPWAILTAFVALWGAPFFVKLLDSFTLINIHIPGLDKVVYRMPPVAPVPTAEAAVFKFNWLSATGTGTFIAAILSGFLMGLKPKEIWSTLLFTIHKTRFTMITIASLMGLGFLTRYCGLDAVLGLACARTGSLYPFFGTLIGWLGTAATGSDTSSNVLFGSLQKVTAQQLGISAALMAAANSGGGVMGKMIAPQSVVVASTATGTYGREGSILRKVIWHSIALACLVGITVSLSLHVPAITNFILR
jgi:lactate permease